MSRVLHHERWPAGTPVILRLRLNLLCMLWLLSGYLYADFEYTIVSWNVRNYLVTDRLVEGVYRKAYPKPEVEKAAVREVLRAIDADIVLLQEMGPDPFLLELQRDLKAEGLEYTYRRVHTAIDEDRHLAVLSRVPFTAGQAERVLDFKYLEGRAQVKRGLMELIFETGEVSWRLFNLHLKSRHTNFREDPESAAWRTAEAVVIRNELRKELRLDPEACFFVAGDFNDEPSSPALMRFRQVNRQPLLELISVADERGDRWTHVYPRADRYTRVDMVLASPAAVSSVNAEESYLFDSPAARIASDHRPVVWTIDMTQMAATKETHGNE